LLVYLLVLGQAAGSAADTEPPLNQPRTWNRGGYAGLGCSSEQLLGATVPSHCRRPGKKSNEDYSKTCPAGMPATEAATECPLPQATAFDHQQKLFLVRNDSGEQTAPELMVIPDNVRDDSAHEWIAKYDASDRAGNEAEQIVFAIILDDDEKPAITPMVNFPLTLEACDMDNVGQSRQSFEDRILPLEIAMNNIDENLCDQLQIEVKAPHDTIGTTYTQGTATQILM
jgi:hypothetical protein